MTTTTGHREPQASAWRALLAAAELPTLPALPDVADALADMADPAGLIDPPPTAGELATTTGWGRVAVAKAVRALAAAGRLAPTPYGLQLALPHRPITDDHPEDDDL